jgi:hypothetical protein
MNHCITCRPQLVVSRCGSGSLWLVWQWRWAVRLRGGGGLLSVQVVHPHHPHGHQCNLKRIWFGLCLLQPWAVSHVVLTCVHGGVCLACSNPRGGAHVLPPGQLVHTQ